MVKRCRLTGTFALGALLLLALPALAWNSTGHEVVAEVAWKELRPGVRDKVLAILKAHPQFDAHLAPSDVTADAPEFGQRVFMRGAIWADEIRAGRGKDREFHRPEWHYVNVPILAGGIDRNEIETPPIGEQLEEGKPPQNIVQALEWATGRLKSPDVSLADKAVALTWLEHLVGDLHQPLHSCAFFSPDYPKGDRGGNSFMVKYHGSVTNLHAFWDERLGGYMNWKLVDAVTERAAAANPRASLAKELASPKFADWSAESYAIAKDVVYLGGELRGATREANAASRGAAAPELPEKYDETARETARRRAALAGYRLADLLDAILK